MWIIHDMDTDEYWGPFIFLTEAHNWAEERGLITYSVFPLYNPSQEYPDDEET